MQQFKDGIKNYIVEKFLYGQDDPAFQEDASFLEKGVIDSTGVLELVAFIQEHYGIQVHDEEIIPDNFDSVNKLAAFVGRKKNGSL